MIRYIYDDGRGEFIASASGKPSVVASELGCLVSVSYNMFRSQRPDVAEDFKKLLIISLAPNSPVWDKEEIPDPKVGIKMVHISEEQEA